MTPDDDEPTEEELREAAALARALDGGRASPDLPEEALGAAALLRYAKDGGALDPKRADAILADAVSRARPKRTSARGRLLGLFGLAAAGAAVVLLTRSPAPEATALPSPPRALLESQILAASAASDVSKEQNPVASRDLDTLGKAMDGYRAQMFASLEERYRR